MQHMAGCVHVQGIGDINFWNVAFDGSGQGKQMLGEVLPASLVRRGQKFYDLQYTDKIRPGMCVTMTQKGESEMAVCHTPGPGHSMAAQHRRLRLCTCIVLSRYVRVRYFAWLSHAAQGLVRRVAVRPGLGPAVHFNIALRHGCPAAAQRGVRWAPGQSMQALYVSDTRWVLQVTRILVNEPVPYDMYTGDPIVVEQISFISEVGVENIKVMLRSAPSSWFSLLCACVVQQLTGRTDHCLAVYKRMGQQAGRFLPPLHGHG
jgi:hypothetical protein